MKPAIKETGFLVSEPHLPFTAFINSGIGADMHWHTYIEMLYVINGCVSITVESDTFKAMPGDFIIVNSNEPHSSRFFTDIPSEVLVIQFEPSVINPNLGSLYESHYMLPFLQRETKYSRFIKLEKGCEFELMLADILNEFALKNPGYELNIKGGIYRSFAWLIRNNHISVPSSSSLAASDLLKLKKLLEYIEGNYSDDITNNMAAEMSCMSYHYFCRFFKRVTGKTFIEYLSFVRLCEAEKLLLNSTENVSQIALNVGFPNVSYFNRLFRREKGITPLSFRKQNKPSK